MKDGQITQESIGEVELVVATLRAMPCWFSVYQSRKRNVFLRHMEKRITTAKSPLKSILRSLPGGWHTAFVLLKEVAAKNSESEEARLLAAYEELASVDLLTVTAEKIADAAGMTERRMLEIIVGTAWERGVRLSRLIEALNLEKTMKRAVLEAQKPNGFKDRERILQSAGLYPAPPGNVVNVDARGLAAAAAEIGKDLATAEGLDEFERDTLDSTSFLRGVDAADPEQKKLESPAKFVEATVVREKTVETAP